MKAIRLILAILFIAFLKSFSSAQEIIEALPRWQSVLHVNYLMPDEPVNSFVTENKIGFQIEFQYRVQYNKPFLGGAYYSEFTSNQGEIA